MYDVPGDPDPRALVLVVLPPARGEERALADQVGRVFAQAQRVGGARLEVLPRVADGVVRGVAPVVQHHVDEEAAFGVALDDAAVVLVGQVTARAQDA